MKTMTINTSAKKRGISLIEGVLYLVLALSVIVGGIVFFQQAQLSNNVTNTSRAVTGISSQVRGVYQNAQDFGIVSDNLTNMIVAAGGAPSNFIDNNGTALDSSDDLIVHPFEGNLDIFADDGAVAAPGGVGRYFTVQLDNLGKAECVRLASLSPAGDGPLGTSIVAVGVEPGADSATHITPDFAAAAPAPAAPSAAGAATLQFSSLNPVTPGVGMTAANANGACADEGNMVYAVFAR